VTSVPLQILSPSKLFADFVTGVDSIWNRFEHREVTDVLIEQRSKHGASRKRLVALVEQGMRSVELSILQKQSLKALGERAVVVATGQQIGLLGGPLYTLLKVASAAQLASELAEQYAHTVVPVFWLEDNDHDAKEASTAVFSLDGVLQTSTVWNGSEERLPVSRRTYSADEVERIKTLLPSLKGPFESDVQRLLEGVYVEGAAWNDAFVRLLQPFLAAWGVLVVRGSDVIASGLHAPILERDLASPGMLSSLVREASASLETLGYHVQATPTHAMFFRHDEAGGRQRIQPDENFLELAHAQPALFSPNALARPIVQDAVLPTIAAVLGPAEIAYHAQLREAYAACGVPMPVPYNRHSATLLDAKTTRNLVKEGLQAVDMMRAWQSVESETVSMLGEDSVPSPEFSASAVDAVFAGYASAAESIDKTLSAAVEAGKASTRNTLEAIRGKLRSALRRKNIEQLERRRTMHKLIFPLDVYQERIYPVAYMTGQFGTDGLRIIVEHIVKRPRIQHVIIGPEDITSSQEDITSAQ